jgi:rSAM/selenodomain-associated transferase 1
MVGAAQADAVAVLTRAPSAGGKSRLFAALGCAPDPALLTALLLDTLDHLRAAPVRLVVVVDPATAIDEVRALVPADVGVLAQHEGTLGLRMRAAMADCFAAGASRVALVGSDLPAISAAAVTEAFARLASDPDALVLGPAADGGYYLIAAAAVPDVFDGIDWSTNRVLDQTRRAAAAAGLRVSLVAPLADIDTAADLQRLVDRDDGRSTRTAAWARAHGMHPP